MNGIAVTNNFIALRTCVLCKHALEVNYETYLMVYPDPSKSFITGQKVYITAVDKDGCRIDTDCIEHKSDRPL